MTTPNALVELTRQAMDAVGSTRWTDAEVLNALTATFEDEWSRLLSAAPYYRAHTIAVTTASNGTLPLSSLDTGTGNSQRRFYRVLSINDGNGLFRETAFADVPMATFSNYLPVYPRIFYLLGEDYQFLPQSTYALNVTVNYRPTAISAIVDPAADNVDWPFGNDYILAYSAGARLLNKGGAEAQAASELNRMADDERDTMLDDIRRRTIRPTIMGAFDDLSDWAAN